MDLREGLAELDRVADDAVRGASAPAPGDLWSRGERWRRRRRRGSLGFLALGLVVLAGISALTFQRSAPPAPAVEPGAAPTLPDRMYAVSPWLPTGMPGEPVVAAQMTERGTWGGGVPAIAVVTGSGRYLFLDAPRVTGLGQSDLAVSPNGRRLAFWAEGRPSGTANTMHGPVITGVDVVDVVTGVVETLRVATEHGLAPSGLVWSDDDRLVGGHGQYVTGDDGTAFERGSSNTYVSWTWRPGSDADLDPISGLDVDGVDSFAEAAGSRLLLGRRLIDLDTGEMRRVPLSQGTTSIGTLGWSAHLRPDGMLATVGGSGLGERIPNRVALTNVDAEVDRPRIVPGSERTGRVVGWRDARRLVLLHSPGLAASGARDYEMVSLDVATGESEKLIEASENIDSWSWAEDLLSAPVVTAVEPPFPLDPRRLTAMTLTVIVMTAGGFVLWRRLVRP